MAPPFHDSSSSSAHSIYTIPPPTSSLTTRPFSGFGGGTTRDGAAKSKPANATTTTTTATASTVPQQTAAARAANKKPSFVCSPIPAATATFLLRRRLLLPTLAVPALLLAVPPLIMSVLSILAHLAVATHGGGRRDGPSTFVAPSAAILISTLALTKIGRGAIESHAPDEEAKKKALARSRYALPFWSLVISLAVVRVVRVTLYCFGVFASSGGGGGGGGRGWTGWVWRLATSTLFWTVRVTGAVVGPALGWTVMSILVALRYAGPLFPIVRCSSTPLRTNPFDATFQRLGRNFTSKNRFLDMIADALDKLSAPSDNVKVAKNPTRPGAGMQSTNRTKSTPFATTMNGPAKISAANPPPVPQSDNGKDGLARILDSLVSSSGARYSRPGLLSILVQVLVNAVGGNVFAQAFVVPHLGEFGFRPDHDAVAIIAVLSCLLVPVTELFSSINEAELHYKHYSSVGGSLADGSRRFHLQPVMVGLARDILHRVRRSVLSVTILVPVIATCIVLLWSKLVGALFLSDGPSILASPSFSAIVQSLIVSYLSVTLLLIILATQDVLTRWAVCAPGLDADILMFQTPATSTKDGTFLAEDLIIQSILMGDGTTVKDVIALPRTNSNETGMMPFKNHQEEEISRNEMASTSFAERIQQSSTNSSGKLSDDILRMCLLESLGGGGSASAAGHHQAQAFHFGDARHNAAVRKRRDLSAATASPGQQPIAVPVVRALCAFAGGVGDAMFQIYHQADKDGKPLRKNISAELWKLPPGSLHAAEFSVIAAARLAVMNSVMADKRGRLIVNASKRHERLALLLPCVLQSAYKLRCGINEYAKATADMYEVNLSTYDKSGKGDGVGSFIEAKCTELCPVLDACNDSAKMAMKALVESGDHSLEDVLLRRKWKGDMRRWLVGLH